MFSELGIKKSIFLKNAPNMEPHVKYISTLKLS
jgi:hypothetical protein